MPLYNRKYKFTQQAVSKYRELVSYSTSDMKSEFRKSQPVYFVDSDPQFLYLLNQYTKTVFVASGDIVVDIYRIDSLSSVIDRPILNESVAELQAIFARLNSSDLTVEEIQKIILRLDYLEIIFRSCAKGAGQEAVDQLLIHARKYLGHIQSLETRSKYIAAILNQLKQSCEVPNEQGK